MIYKFNVGEKKKIRVNYLFHIRHIWNYFHNFPHVGPFPKNNLNFVFASIPEVMVGGAFGDAYLFIRYIRYDLTSVLLR